MRLKEGYLVKDPVAGKMGTAKRRFFLLTDDAIEWFRQADSCTKPKGRLPLDGARVERQVASLSVISERGVLVLRGEDLDGWEDSIREAIDGEGGSKRFVHVERQLTQNREQLAAAQAEICALLNLLGVGGENKDGREVSLPAIQTAGEDAGLPSTRATMHPLRLKSARLGGVVGGAQDSWNESCVEIRSTKLSAESLRASLTAQSEQAQSSKEDNSVSEMGTLERRNSSSAPATAKLMRRISEMNERASNMA